MKITVPALRTDVVGFRYDQPSRFYYNCPNRPNIVPFATYEVLTETELTSAVIFDRDLRFATRAKAVAAIAALTVVAPVVIVGAVAARFILATYEVVTDIARDVPELLQIVADGYVDLTRQVIR